MGDQSYQRPRKRKSSKEKEINFIMKNPYLLLSMNIVAIFIIAILLSLVPDHLHNFFGDWLCEGRTYDGTTWSGCDINSHSSYGHNPQMHWGYRHWLWLSMCIALFVVQLFRIIDIISTKFKDQPK